MRKGSYLYLNGHTYCLIKEEAHGWHNAQSICESWGGHLAIVDTAEKSALLTNYLTSNVIEVYDILIGVYLPAGWNVGYPSSWMWVDGTSMNTTGYQNWYPGEPEGSNSRFGSAVLNKDYDWKWDFRWVDDTFDSRTWVAWYWCEWDFMVLPDLISLNTEFLGFIPNGMGLLVSKTGLVTGTPLLLGNHVVDVQVKTRYGEAVGAITINVVE